MIQTINKLQAIALAALIALVLCTHSALQTTGYSATLTLGHQAAPAHTVSITTDKRLLTKAGMQLALAAGAKR